MLKEHCAVFNDGMLARYRASAQSRKILALAKIRIKQWLGAHGWEVTWFTVCSLDFLLEKYGLDELRTNGDRIITCGGRNCRSCMRCYGTHEKQDVIELLKQDTARAKRLGVKIGGGQ